MSASQPINVREMAIVHRMFRTAYQEAAQLVRAGPAPSPGRVKFLADHIDLAVMALPYHHQDEEEMLYPKLIERAPEQVRVTEEVEREHQQIAAALQTASAACAAWRARPSAQTGEALAAALDQLNVTAQPHLDDEEQKVVPLAAVTLTQQEWDAIGKHAVTRIPRNRRGIGRHAVAVQHRPSALMPTPKTRVGGSPSRPPATALAGVRGSSRTLATDGRQGAAALRSTGIAREGRRR